ncbi:MAG TPA: TldD/PmbA family protein [Thermoplasmata archaeon]|nr:TldD/PmbA family protein [Thermoplasmata archaeon]
MADSDLVDFAVDYAQQKGAAYAEARWEQHATEFFTLKNGGLDALVYTTDEGIGVRVLAGGSLGFTATNRLNKTDVKGIVDDAVRIAKATKRKNPISFTLEPSVTSNWSVPERKKLADTPLEDKVKEVQEFDRALVDLKYKMPARYFVSTNLRISKYFANSEGSRIHSYSPRVRMYYYLTLTQGNDVEQAYRNYGWSGGWEALQEWKTHENVLQEARTCKNALDHGVKSPEGKMDLVVGPPVAGIMAHESCGHPTEADRVLGREASQAGKSFITPQAMGDKVGSPAVTVVDDPTVEHAIAYYLYDDEGVRARRRYLYKAGKITEFLQNRETAATLRTRSNGASRATSYDREPIPRMANTFVEPGEWDVDEMIEGVKRGVWMKTYMEWNIDDKRYNGKYVGREAYLIENGEVKGPVRKTVVELTTPMVWGSVDACGNDLLLTEAGFCGKSDPGQALDACLGGPTMRLRNVYLR